MDVDDCTLTFDMNVSMERREWNSVIHLRFRTPQYLDGSFNSVETMLVKFDHFTSEITK